MPKSRRDKRVSLTETKKKGREAKENLVEKVKECVETYDRAFVFNVNNMRNNKLKEVRSAWKHSRFFFGKNKVISHALGKTPANEMGTNLHKLTGHLVQEVGVLFTNKSVEDVRDWFDKYVEHAFARAGNVATSTVKLAEGPLKQFSHAIEPHLRQLGLPVKLEKGVVTMLQDHNVCKEGEVITPEQAKVLKLLNIVMTQFSISIQCAWNKADGKFEEFEVKQPEKAFNVIRVTEDDQEYDYVEKEEDMAVAVETSS